MPDFSVVLLRPNFMLVFEEHPMKAHKNQCLLNLLAPDEGVPLRLCGYGRSSMVVSPSSVPC